MIDGDPTYKERERELAASVGYAISKWANIELQLIYIFSHILKLEEAEAARLLDGFNSFSITLNLISVAVRGRLAKSPALTFWKSLENYLRELSGDRNLIAHSAIVRHSTNLHGETSSSHKFVPKIGPSFEKLMAGSKVNRIADTQEVKEMEKDFIFATGLLAELTLALKNGEPLPEKFSQEVVRRRPSRSDRSQASRKGKKNPPQSSRA